MADVIMTQAGGGGGLYLAPIAGSPAKKTGSVHFVPAVNNPDGTPNYLPSVDATETQRIAARHPYMATKDLGGGLLVPNDQRAAQAGLKAFANQLALDLQAGRITQDVFNRAMATLTPPIQVAPALDPAKVAAAQQQVAQVIATQSSGDSARAAVAVQQAIDAAAQSLGYSAPSQSSGDSIRATIATAAVMPKTREGGGGGR